MQWGLGHRATPGQRQLCQDSAGTGADTAPSYYENHGIQNGLGWNGP